MLHRSFKPAKFKTALRLATSRIKLLKNKKDVQLKQMKRDLAQLLESGQDQTARIRVEHVVREEKMNAAYELIEIYCELIAARLPIIESQKNCPIDLKEAITSVVFASPRCADIPELLDIRKHLTAKYGKEFISAAVELRPECGVSRMLVEKLSAKAPDGQTKIKILSAIAEEHNIKWDAESFGEKDSKPPDDLLNGPNTFEKASRMQAEPANIQVPNVRPPPIHDPKHASPLNFSEQNTRSSLGAQNFTPTDTSGTKITESATSHLERRPSGMGGERMEVRQPYPGDDNSFSMSRQNWNMEFKDATSAAQAAAESAERASMAARAAAELSSRGKITRQYSTESQKSNSHGLRDEGRAKYSASNFPVERPPKDVLNNSSLDRNKFPDEQLDGNQHSNLARAGERLYQNDHFGTKSSKSASVKSNKHSVDDESVVNSLRKEESYSQKNSSKVKAVKAQKGPFSAKTSMENEFTESAVEFGSVQQEDFKIENVDYFREENDRKSSSPISSHSHSSSFDDDYNVSNSNQQNFRNDAGDQGSIFEDTVETSSYGVAAGVYDESGSVDDDDDSRSDIGPKFDEWESKSYIQSPGRKSPNLLTTHIDAWSPRSNMSKSVDNFSTEMHSSPEFSEVLGKSLDHSQPDDTVPLAFDDSDGLNSDSEDELDKSRLGGTEDSKIPPKQNDHQGSTRTSLLEKQNSESDRKPWLHSSSDDMNSTEVHPKYNQGMEINADSLPKFGFDKSPANQPSSRPKNSRWELNDVGSELSTRIPADEGNNQQSPWSSRILLADEVKDNVHVPNSPDTLKDNELSNQSSFESGNELKFGKLTGGLRNKGYRHPPYIRTPSGNASSFSKKASEDTSTVIEEPTTTTTTVRSSVNSGASTKVDDRLSSRVEHSDSDTDDSGEQSPQEIISSRPPPNAQKAGKEVKKKSSLRASVTYIDPDDGNSEEDLPKQTFSSRTRLGSQFSRRTKASPETSSKVRVRSETKVNSDPSAERKPTTNSYGAEPTPKPLSQIVNTKGSPSSSETNAYSKVRAGSDTTVNSNPRAEKKPTRSSYGAETPSKPLPQTVNKKGSPSSAETNSYSKVRVGSETTLNSDSNAERTSTGSSYGAKTPPNPIQAKQAASDSLPKSNISSRKESLKPSAVEQPSSSLQKIPASSRTENPKTSTSVVETPSRDNSLKKASHVHPKLPDYETFAAHFESLRSDR